MKIETIDLEFRTEEIIASFLLTGGLGCEVETGPMSCIDNPRGAQRPGRRPRGGGAGPRRHPPGPFRGVGEPRGALPNATFYVHEIGHPHLVDPSKPSSASRLYGEENMDELWGEVRPVPEIAFEAGRRRGHRGAGGVAQAHYTPGHAYHHLAFYEPGTGHLFAGDVAGGGAYRASRT